MCWKEKIQWQSVTNGLRKEHVLRPPFLNKVLHHFFSSYGFIHNHLTLRKWCYTPLQHDFALDPMIPPFVFHFSNSKSAVFRMYHALTLYGYSNFINAVKRQRNLGLGTIQFNYVPQTKFGRHITFTRFHKV
jgi:hypothetical protein